jgi:copper(I)-binding protein
MVVVEQAAAYCAVMSRVVALIAVVFLIACGPGAEVKSGRELYLAYGCAACHGANADGRGPGAALAQVKPRDLTNLAAYARGNSLEAIAATIANGANGMPGYPDIPQREREAMAEYLRSLAAKPARVAVFEAWVRTPNPAVDVAAGYMTLVSTADEPLSVAAISCPAANVVEMHEMATVDGMMTMRKTNAIRIPPHATAKLAPGGPHLMLIGLRKPLPRQTEFTLRLDDGTSVTTTALFRDED